MRMCVVVVMTFNPIAMELDLSFGGYGILRMCNNTFALINFVLRGETSSYLLLSMGRYLNQIVSYLINLRDNLSKNLEGKSNLQHIFSL